MCELFSIHCGKKKKRYASRIPFPNLIMTDEKERKIETDFNHKIDYFIETISIFKHQYEDIFETLYSILNTSASM